MPVQRCQRDNKKGFKFGPMGKCYLGPSARNKAVKQGRAIELSKQMKK